MSVRAPLQAAIVADIERATRATFALESIAPVSGGSINATYVFRSNNANWFVKVNRAERAQMFEAEAYGLRALAAETSLEVPRVLTSSHNDENAWLVLSCLALTPWSRTSEVALGRGLAALHRRTSDQFGFAIDNWLGTTPQPNANSSNWTAFYRDQRLRYQLELATHKAGAPSDLLQFGTRLLHELDGFFAGYAPVASLLHGDLWSGNAAATRTGGAAVFDPAPYFGDRETDIAMTQLFGGFGADFYAAYREAWPLDRGFSVRRDLYNLYHVLNHFNLFGGGYGSQAVHIMQGLLAEI